MPIYQRGSSWIVSVGSGKNRYRATFGSLQEAEQAELEEKQRRRASKDASGKPVEGPRSAAQGSVDRKTLGEAYERTYRLHWRGTKSEYTHVLNATAVLKALGKETLVSDIDTEDITEMILEFEDQGNSGSTVNRKLSALSMILKTAKEQWPNSVPVMPALTRRKEGRHRIRWMDEDEENKVLEACNRLGLSDLKDFIVVAIDTGFRRSELLGFKLEDYRNGLLVLHEGETKTDQARAVPATSRVATIIHRRKDQYRLFDGLNHNQLRWQWDRLREYVKMGDDPQFVVHMLRHTCASRMVQRGVPLAVVQKWMGHTTINTTMRYAHLAPNSLDVAREALEARPQDSRTRT